MAYYERGVFIDQGIWVVTRLWKDGQKVKDFATLKPKGVRRHDGSIEVQFAENPASAQEAADRWGSTVEVREVNPGDAGCTQS